MAVHDPGMRRQEGGVADEVGLQLPRLVGLQPPQILDAGVERVLHVMAQPLDLVLVARDHELAQPLVRHAVLGAIGIHQVRGAREQMLPQSALLVVQPGVDHFGVARGGVLADAGLRFQHQHLAAGRRQRARHGEADHAGADDDAVG